MLRYSSLWNRRPHRLYRSHWNRQNNNIFLALAARHGSAEICEKLIQHGTSPNLTATLGFGDTYSVSSPLIEAAKAGDVNISNILLRGGAGVNYRYAGLTATGHPLLALKKDNRHREGRLEILKLFLERGADVNAPFRDDELRLQEPDDGTETSAETLLDEAVLNGDEDVRRIFCKPPFVGGDMESPLNVSGIISCAYEGSREVESYLQSMPFPRDSKRRRIQEAALKWALDRANVQAVLSMIQAGFGIKSLLLAKDGSHRNPQPGSTGGYLEGIFGNSPWTPLSRQLALVLLQGHHGTEIEYALIETCCLRSERSDVLEFLTPIVLNSTETSYTVLVALAARLNNFAAVSFLKQHCAGLYGTAKFWNGQCSALLLSAATLKDSFAYSSLLARSRPASTDMLGFLVRQGAEINTCHPSLWTQQYWLSGEQLKWLRDNLNGVEYDGISIYSIMFPSMQDPPRFTSSGDKDSAERSILQSLDNLGVPILSAHESESLRHYRNFETDVHPLSFFISLKPGPDFIDRVLEAGIDVNGTGRLSGADTPLQAAARANDYAVAEKLVSRGAQVRCAEQHCELTTLQLACGVQGFGEMGIKYQPIDPRISKLLLRHGADPNGRGKYCCISPLQLAHNARVVELLLAYGADANEPVTRCEACALEHFHSFSLELRKYSVASILHLAATRRRVTKSSRREVVEVLLGKGARVDERERIWDDWARRVKLGRNAFEIAAGVRADSNFGRLRRNIDAVDIDVVRLLLQNGAEVGLPAGYHGDNALAGACDHENLDIVKLLLDWKIDPNPTNRYSRPPLSIAAEKGNLAIALLLVSAGARVMVGGQGGIASPLVAAASRGRLDMVSFLMGGEKREETFKEAISGAKNWGHAEVALCIQEYVEQQRRPPAGKQPRMEELS
ncbi:hypothetical protein MFIFM68171_02778 [Madurella fahalii]|uniref:Ankyrin n=1 Tax=Madurella fahalii TaxID=1157608 RepID=A0ABQ0G4A1_9PEZI